MRILKGKLRISSEEFVYKRFEPFISGNIFPQNINLLCGYQMDTASNNTANVHLILKSNGTYKEL